MSSNLLKVNLQNRENIAKRLLPLKRLEQVLIEKVLNSLLYHKGPFVHVPIILLEEYVLLKDLSDCAQSQSSFGTYNQQQEKYVQ